MPQEEKSFLSTEGLTELITKIKSMTPGGGSGGNMPYTNHNSGFRGKNLGTTFTTEQKAAIAAGTFDDIYVGDYWTFGSTVWRIVDIDIFYHHGDPRCTEHHVVIMPDEALFSSSWSDTMYGNTDIATTKLPAEAATLEAIIGTYLLDKEYQVYKDTTNYYQWVKYKMIVPSFHNFFGQYDLDHTANFPSNQPNQFALFRYRPDFINSQQSVNFWGIDVYSSYNVRITHTRVCDWKPSSDSYGIRPYALLAGVDQSQE